MKKSLLIALMMLAAAKANAQSAPYNSTNAAMQVQSVLLNDVVKKTVDSADKAFFARNTNKKHAGEITGVWSNVSYVSEDVKLDSLKIDNKAYVAMLGVDIKGEMQNEWETTYSVYGGYINSSQDYEATSTDQNGFLIGAGARYNKDNIFTAMSANLSTNFVDIDNYINSEDFEMYVLSLASKTGAKLNLYCEQYVLEPSLILAYHYMHTPDYNNAIGVDVEADDLNIFSITPELKLVADYGHFQPYAVASYNWNLHSGGDVKNNGILQPGLNADQYAEFSVGLSIYANDSVSGYAEANAMIGDREGYGGKLGMKVDF